jgi:hypothetical protein
MVAAVRRLERARVELADGERRCARLRGRVEAAEAEVAGWTRRVEGGR